uniref:Low-density lipoprotein receptor related-protein 13 n=1 Tax=Sinocyclocheilus grahami TaxID=75366 RepID=A0A672JZX3_SINGR
MCTLCLYSECVQAAVASDRVPLHCRLGFKPCKDGSECVLYSNVCDGENDCPDGSDEDECAAVCCQFQCAHGKKCIERRQVCDVDCFKPEEGCGHRCDKNHCIPESFVCDGDADCVDGSDEASCGRGEESCSSAEWRCSSGQCVSVSMCCDGPPDCRDHSDEEDCAEPPPCSTQCRCSKSQECLLDEWICDGEMDCKDGTDEKVCWAICALNDQKHYIMHYKMIHLVVLISADHLFHVRQNCKESPVQCGEFQWPCASNTQCIPQAWRCDGSEDCRDGSNESGCELIQFCQTGTASLSLSLYLSVSGISADSLAVDWVARNLYWADSVNSQINALGLDTAATRTTDIVMILGEDLGQLRSIALLPQKGIMFWSETGDDAQIERAGMDGSDRRVLVNHSLRWPVSLMVDSLHHRIYWTDEKLKYKSDQPILMEEILSPFSVSVFNDKVYWSDTKRGTIQRAHESTGKQHQVLLKRPGQPFGLKVIHALFQVGVSNPCASQHCSYLCVLSPGLKAVCKCPSRFLLDEDGLTCTKPKDSSFLLFLSPTAITQTQRYLKNWPEHRRFDLPNMNKSTMLDLVLRDLTLYVSDGGQPIVGLFKMKDTALVPRGKLLQLHKDWLGAFSVDWITLNVYWSSEKLPGLQVTSPDGTHTSVLIQDGLGAIESIALDPSSGRLCFSNKVQEGQMTRVECAYMNGQNRTVVWSNSVQPISLVLMDEGNKLYWADTGMFFFHFFIYSHDKLSYAHQKRPHAVRLSFAKTHLEDSECWFSDDKHTGKLWFDVDTDIVSLKAFAKSRQKGTNLCSNGNGGCSHLCLAFPGGMTCHCAHNHRLVNGKDCSPDPRCPQGTKPCLNEDICLPLEQFCKNTKEGTTLEKVCNISR